jgi:hypothetical protein
MSISQTGAVTGAVRVWLRLEGLAVLAVALFLYQRGGHSWLWFGVLLLAPDLVLAAYLAGPRVGAWGYNLVHSYTGPIAAAVIALVSGRSLTFALIWLAHVGMDRAAGYGLKYSSAFADTHLGALGGGRREVASSPG